MCLFCTFCQPSIVVRLTVFGPPICLCLGPSRPIQTSIQLGCITLFVQHEFRGQTDQSPFVYIAATCCLPVGLPVCPLCSIGRVKRSEISDVGAPLRLVQARPGGATLGPLTCCLNEKLLSVSCGSSFLLQLYLKLCSLFVSAARCCNQTS